MWLLLYSQGAAGSTCLHKAEDRSFCTQIKVHFFIWVKSTWALNSSFIRLLSSMFPSSLSLIALIFASRSAPHAMTSYMRENIKYLSLWVCGNGSFNLIWWSPVPSIYPSPLLSFSQRRRQRESYLTFFVHIHTLTDWFHSLALVNSTMINLGMQKTL